MKLLSKIVFAVYLLTLLWLVLLKFSLDISLGWGYQAGLNVIPFAGLSGDSWREMVDNFVIFVPFGLLLSVNLDRVQLRRKLGYIFAFSLMVEVVQFGFGIGIADVTDVILNTSGGLLGLLLYGLGARYVRSRSLDRGIVVVGALLLALVHGILFSGTVRFRSGPPASLAPTPAAFAQGTQLAWPSAGQAAVGSVEDGLLGRSSADETPRPMASMAKVITALAIMEKQPLKRGQAGPSYTITAKDVANFRAEAARGGSVVPVHEGMVLTQYQALQMMLLASGNNIADTLAERVFGSQEAYASYAQDMVRRRGLSRTTVDDASGFSPATVSTPSELVNIGIAALKDPVIAEIVSQPQAQIPDVGILKNTNELLGTNGVIGIKTGTTKAAGNCLLSAARYKSANGKTVTVVAVIMGDKSADSVFGDSNNLLASARQGLGLEPAAAQPSGSVAALPLRPRDRVPGQ